MAGRSLRVNGDAGRSASFGEGWPTAATWKQAKAEAQRRLQAASTRRDDGGRPPWGDRATVETARPARAAAGRCTGRRGASASAATRGLLRQGGSGIVRVRAHKRLFPPGSWLVCRARPGRPGAGSLSARRAGPARGARGRQASTTGDLTMTGHNSEASIKQ